MQNIKWYRRIDRILAPLVYLIVLYFTQCTQFINIGRENIFRGQGTPCYKVNHILPKNIVQTGIDQRPSPKENKLISLNLSLNRKFRKANKTEPDSVEVIAFGVRPNQDFFPLYRPFLFYWKYTKFFALSRYISAVYYTHIPEKMTSCNGVTNYSTGKVKAFL